VTPIKQKKLINKIIEIMSKFNVPSRAQVSDSNQAIFDQLQKGLGFVPNIYASFAHSETALSNFLAFGNGKTSFSAKEKEVINLAVSQVNECIYCLSAHTAIGKMNGFTEDQILELRSGNASFNEKLDALAKFSKSVALNRGAATQEAIENFYNAGFSKGNLADAILLIGEITITNYFHRTIEVPVDFPVVQSLEITSIS
jgi:uncharacterized peroxidase-related enzyme